MFTYSTTVYNDAAFVGLSYYCGCKITICTP